MSLNTVVTLCITALFIPTSAPATQPSAAQARAVFAETSHAFGPVTQGAVLSHTFTVRNDGDRPLRIDGVDLQGPGMKTSFKALVAPGETGRITIEWNTAGANGPSQAKAVVRLADAPPSRVDLALTAIVTRSIDILPMNALYFSVYKGETLTRSVTVVNRESTPLEIVGIEPAGDHFTATLMPVTPGQTYRLDVTVPSTASVGRFMESVSLVTNNATVPRVTVAVNVLVKNHLYVNPERVELGRIRIAELTSNPGVVQLLTQKLIVRKRAGDFAITSLSSDVGAVKVTVSTQGRAEAFEIEVSVIQNRLVPGRLAGAIRIETDDKEFPLLQVPIVGEVR
jgi:hypothetical protein